MILKCLEKVSQETYEFHKKLMTDKVEIIVTTTTLYTTTTPYTTTATNTYEVQVLMDYYYHH